MLNFFKELGIITKAILLLALLLIIYSFLCRVIGIYFFWESVTFGWFLLLIGVILIFLERMKVKNSQKKNSVGEQVGIGIFSLVLLVFVILMITVSQSNAYEAAKLYLSSDSLIKAEVGTIEDFVLKPMGSIQKSTDSQGESGNATILITVKGDKQYKDLTIYVSKSPDTTAWIVEGIE